MLRVLPGVELVFASLLFKTALIKEDLPTFERPMKAISGKFGGNNWDGLKHELYSNVFSKVTTPERTLQGTYFRSDERMTHYTVSNSKGSFTTESMEEKDESKHPADTAQQQVEQPLRPQTPKHPKTLTNS